MSAQFKKENIKGEEGEGRKGKPLHKMAPGGCDAILQEALLLGSYADFWKLATGYTKALCNVYVAPNPYPTPGGGNAADGHNPNSATQNMVKVTTTVPCSLRTFATFITAPRSVRYCEDNVMFCDIIERDNKTKLFHTAYAGDPPCDVVAVHITAAYKVPENTTENNPLCKFVASLRDDKRRGHVPQPSSTIFVYAMKSAEHPKTPPSPPYVRMRFHLSAFIAYEIPGPLVRVVFVHAPGDRTPKMVDRCITKMVCVRNLCQMLEWLNTGGPLTEPVIWENQRPQETPNAHSVGAENTREPNPLVEEPSDVVLQGDNPSSAPGRVFQTLFALHASAAWRLVLQHEGCTVEECEARCCFPAPAFLKAYRFATTIACSLDIFRRLVSDPMQLHRYDPSVEKVELLHSQKGEDTVHIHFKQLSHSAPKQDACILTSNALLQPDEAHRWRLYQLTDNINVVYVQNGIQSTEIPAAGACDRQVVYAMGYVAIPSVKRQPTGAGDGNEGSEALRVYHVVCVDNNTASFADKQLVTIRQHFFRLTGIRNLCDEAKSKPPTCSLPPHTTRDVNDFFESGTLAGFTEVETLEDASLERTSSTNNVRRQLDLVDGMEGYTSHATAHVDTMMNSSSLEKLHQFLLHFAPHYCIEHKQSELDNKLVPAAAALQPSPFTEQQQISPSVWQAHAPTPDQQKQEVQTAQLVQRGKVSAPPAIQQSGGKAALTWDTSVEEVVPDKQKQEVQTAQLVQRGKVSAPPAIQQIGGKAALTWDTSVEEVVPDKQKQEVQTAQLVQRGKVSAPPAIQQIGGKAALTWDTSVEEVVPDKQKQEVQTAQLVQCGKVSAPPAIQQIGGKAALTWDTSVEEVVPDKQKQEVQTAQLVQRGKVSAPPAIQQSGGKAALTWDTSVEEVVPDKQKQEVQTAQLVQRGKVSAPPAIQQSGGKAALTWDTSVEEVVPDKQKQEVQTAQLVQRGKVSAPPAIQQIGGKAALTWDTSVEEVVPDKQKQEVQTAQLVQRGKVSAPPAIQQIGGKAALTWDTSVEEVVPDKQKQEVQTAQLVQRGKVSAPPAIQQIGGKAALTWDTSVEEVVPDKQKQEVQTAQLVQRGKVSAPPAIQQIGGKAALTWDTSVEEVVPDKQKQEVQTAQLVQRGKVSAPPAIQQSGGKAALTWDTSVEEVVPDKQKQEVQTAQLVQRGKVSAPPAIQQSGGKAALTWDTSVEEVVPDKQKQEVQTAQLVQRGKVSAPPAIQQSGGKAALTWDTSVEEVVPDKQKQEVQTAQLVQCGKVSAPPAIQQSGGKAALTWDTSVEEVVPDKQKQEVQTAQLVQCGKVSAPPAIQQSGGKAALTWDTSVEEVVPDKQKQEVQTAQLVQCGKVSAPPAIQQIGGKAALTWDTSVEEVVPDKQKQEVQTAQLVQRGKVSAPPAIQQSGGKAALTWDTSVEEVVPDKQKQEVQTAQLVQRGKVSAPPAIQQSEKGAIDRKEKNVHMKNFMQAIHTEGEPVHRRRDDERLGLQPLQRKKGFQSIPTNLEEEASPVQVIGEESKRNSGEPQPVGGQGDCLARAVREGQEKLTRLTGGWCKGRIEKTSAFGEKDSPVQEVQVKENIPQVTCGLSVWPTPDALKVRREGMSVLKLSQRLELRPARQEPRRQEELIWPMKGGWQGSSGSVSDGNEGLLLPMGSRSVDTDDVWEERVKLSDGTFGRKVNNKIQVNVRACRNMPAATQKKHMLSIQISTSSTEAQTWLVPLTLNPIFPHQTILLDEPEDDTVNVTAIVKTEDDRMKRLGEAVVSLRYLHVLDSYTRWISLICNVGTSDAFECGDVCITFRRGTEEGPNGVVSINGKQCEQQQLQWGEAERTQEEEKLRRYVRDVLVSAGNANLHLLEWLVGNCYRKTPGEIDAFIRRYRKDDTIMLTVFEVCGLRTEVGVPLLRPVPCHVLVETSRGSCTTSPVNLQGQAAPLNMVFHLVIGVNEPIRLIVFTGDTAVGETVITTAQDGTRTRVLVSRAGTEEAVPCGTITVGTRRGSVSELTESPKPLRVEVNEENSKRMAYLHHILWMNARSSLHKLDVIAASPLESGRLLEKFGPTAKWYDLRVSLRHWRPTSAAWDSPIVDNTLGTHKREKDGDELLQHVQTVYRRVFAVVHIGLQYHKTFEVRTDCAGEVHFNETFTFSGVCPRRDEVFVSVIGKGLTGTEDHDLGVTVLSMKSLKLQQRTHMTVPLVRQAGTRGARFQGSLYLELFAVNFDGVAANDYEAEMCRPSIRSILYHHAPRELHKAECFLGSYASREKDCLRELRKTYGPDILKLPMAIRLMSLNQLTPYPNSYLKVYLNDTPVIRTEKLSTDDPILFDPEDSKSRARVLVDDVYDVRLRFKVKQTRFLLTKTLCTGDFSLRGMVVSQEGVYWIPLVDSEGVSVGNLCVELKSSAFVYNDTVKRAKDFVEDDVVSLIRRYRPSKVPIMHMIMEKVSNREAAHSEIRREVVTEPVAATVFISVELLSIHRVFFEQTEEDDQQVWPEGETEYVVTAKYGGDESSTTTKNFTPQGNSSTIRLDVRTFRERKAHKLIITVRRQRTLPPPCPAKSSEAQNGKIPRFGPFCKATPVVSKQRPRVIMPQPPSLLHEPEYVGCAVISLRALFTPLLYSTGELVTVPLLYLPPNANGGPVVPDGRDHTGSGVHSEGEVVGNIAFRVRLPAYEQIPSWLQFDATTLEKEIKLDRAAIRYYEERIRNILAEHKSHCLWNMHYRLYEKYVASGHWHRLLRGWRNALLRQFPSANNSNDVPTSSMWYAPSTASDRDLRSDNMNSILERLKGEFSSDDSLMGDVAETEMAGGENSIETGSGSESESD
ncbi:hypothetical protein, conserved [Trypanosoma brucei brucei TREU927]|uniref:C2 domain-containing protein n=1 Tax=Trypanosoma brucei brucei (strain 927/4 GUTat10.1) TaxID=185431 RepID=Q383I3_TRYB2|nr:hypothetical protein, conserved [Trypanosoma brucei brucei TREU927]EAN80048.1 hypothetical protein, conserved [Trypanosoma brucei brucei TREU927]